MPLSNFKLFPFASCGQGNNFEECQSTILSRNILRKILPDSECREGPMLANCCANCRAGTPDDAGEPGYFANNLVSIAVQSLGTF